MNIAAQPQHLIDGAFAHDYRLLKPSLTPQWLATLALGVTLLAAVYSSWVAHSLPDFAAWTAPILLLIAMLSALLISPRVFAVGYLISLLTFLIAWRIAVMNDAQALVWIASVTSLVLLAQLIDCVVGDWRRNLGVPGAWFGTLVWQATIVRMYFGLNEIGHGTEKIFAGMGSFHHLVDIFQSLGLGSIAPVFVVLAGLTELLLALTVGLGLLTRLGGFIGLGYFLVATVGFGGEWARGYSWATPGGGGWEYVMMLLVVFGSVMLSGAGKFSLDGWLLSRDLIPKWLRVAATNGEGRK